MPLSNAPVPMYVVTPEGAEKMEGLRHALDRGLITPSEFERAVMDVRRDHSPRLAYRPPCYFCGGRSAWRYMATWLTVDTASESEAAGWEHLCMGCMSDVMHGPAELAPTIMEPLGRGVYDPDIAIVMKAWRDKQGY